MVSYKTNVWYNLSCLEQTYYCSSTNKKLLVSWQFSGTCGVTKYDSGWRKDVINQCLEFAALPSACRQSATLCATGTLQMTLCPRGSLLCHRLQYTWRLIVALAAGCACLYFSLPTFLAEWTPWCCYSCRTRHSFLRSTTNHNLHRFCLISVVQ